MRTNFDKQYKYVLKRAHEKLAFIGHTLLVTSWIDDTFRLEIRVSAGDRIHKFIYGEGEDGEDGIILVHKDFDKTKYIKSELENYDFEPGDFTEEIF